MSAQKITPKQQRFVEEYLVDLNASAAARRAGYSPKTAEQQGPRLLGNARVAAAIQVGRQHLAERTARTVDEVMAEIRRIGDQAETIGDWTPALRARELEAKHLGAFTERVQLTGKDGESLSLKVSFENPEGKTHG